MAVTKLQQGVMQALRNDKHQTWSLYDYQWVWGTPSETKRILDALVRKGLVVLEKGTYRPMRSRAT